MKFKILICAVVGFLLGSCNSERKQEKMWDTSVAADSDFVNLDTGNTTIDTISKDTNNLKQ